RAARKPNSNTVKVDQADGDTREKAIASSVLRPSVNAAVTIQQLSTQFGDIDLHALIDALSDHAKVANDGDLKRAEGMLIIQAHTLDAIFNNLARRSALNMGEYMGAAETYMKLALRAQNQCRATLQTLGELKNPQPVAFVKQSNNTRGPQHVNNVPSLCNPDESDSHAGAQTEKNVNQRKIPLQAQPHEQLDARTPSAPGPVKPARASE